MPNNVVQLSEEEITTTLVKEIAREQVDSLVVIVSRQSNMQIWEAHYRLLNVGGSDL